MSVLSEIERLEGAKSALATSIEGKGVAVPEGTKIDGMAALVDQIQGGGGADFYISDASYLFYQHARMDAYGALTKLTNGVTNTSYMFSYSRIEQFSIKEINTGYLRWAVQMFCGCQSLKKVDFDGAKAAGLEYVGGMFKGCWELEEILNFACCRADEILDIFPDTTSETTRGKLRRLTFQDAATYTVPTIKTAIRIRNCSFDRDGMVEMFNTLPDISGTNVSAIYKRITITGNPCVTDGTLTDEDKAIAIGKGWTIVI